MTKKALLDMYDKYEKAGAELEIIAAASTGYGEFLFNKAFRTETHLVETVAHALAASHYFGEDTSFILDIGGQDMKAIWLEKGIITIYDGKNQKDRLVYLPEDLKDLIKQYFAALKHRLRNEPYWFFPGRKQGTHISKSTIDRKFREFWNTTPSSKSCDKAPTPHSLRHGFVVDRINSWILAGVDINAMFIYLSRYLGHKDPDESFYYYHLVSDAFRILRQKDRMSDEVIPGVRRR